MPYFPFFELTSFLHMPQFLLDMKRGRQIERLCLGGGLPSGDSDERISHAGCPPGVCKCR